MRTSLFLCAGAVLGLAACTAPPPHGAADLKGPAGPSTPDLLTHPVDMAPGKSALGGLLPVPIPAEIADVADVVPMRLSDTGLYRSSAPAPPGDADLAPGVMSFQPSYALWSDGAAKSRYIYLPPGSKIDTSNMDRWVFPLGTKLWKEFRVNGTRIETRMIWKHVSLVDNQVRWELATYLWDDDNADAYYLKDGLDNAKGTSFSIPRQNQCIECHLFVQERPIGFSAIQLSGAGTGLRMKDLVKMGWLTNPPPNPDGYVIPGDAVAQRALGYLHANCGGCHAYDSDLYSMVNMVLRLEVDKLDDVLHTPTYTTTANVLNTSLKLGMQGTALRMKPGDPMHSLIPIRMGIRLRASESMQMPPLGTDIVDTDGRNAVMAWIAALTP